jgi:hypothetical protein
MTRRASFVAALQVEDACIRLQQAETSNEIRQQAEKFLLDFRQSSSAQSICRHLLQNSSNPASQYQAIAALKATTLRDYYSLPDQTVSSLRTDLINYVATNFNSLTPFVRKEALHTVAILWKRGFFFGSSGSSDGVPGLYMSKLIVGQCRDLLGHSEPERKAIGLLLCSLVLLEFDVRSADAGSFALGLPLAFHVRCHRYFETHALPNLFSLIAPYLETLTASVCTPAQWLTASEALQQVLCWPFSQVCVCVCVISFVVV